ncbi:MAG: hypothetical protein K2H86_06080, partial [Muribaculaceae bacterium]|nr:hypothetical protein [Muribaculaceae bacterium]
MMDFNAALRTEALAGQDNLMYFNRPQLLCQLIAANTTVLVAGRRTGKTDGVGAPFVYRNMQRMAGSTGGIVVPTFKHGLTNTIPALVTAWRRYGLIEGKHFVIGKTPPKSFAQPLRKPLNSEHVIYFCNGSVAVILSQDRPGAANGLTLSWLLIDEARFIDHTKLKQEIFPANGGVRDTFARHSCNHSMLVLSDMPQTSKGSWFLHYRESMDNDIIECIQGIVAEQWRLKTRIEQMLEKGVTPPEYLRKYRRQLDRKLNRLRSVAVYYRECSTIENLQLVGEKYIAQMKRDLTPLTFQTSILCKRIGIAKDGFYSSMRERHKYTADNGTLLDDRWESADYSAHFDCSVDSDLDPDAPICIGMDYNANINWIVAAQPDDDGGVLRVLKSFYVKYDRKLKELIEDFCTYYAPHRNKTIIFYYDSTALGSNYAVNDQDFRWVIENEFERHGWHIESVYIGQPMHHHEKHLLINRGFAGRQRLQPMFNEFNNTDLLLAIQSAGISRGRNGFSKYKAGEKLKETEEDLLEHR